MQKDLLVKYYVHYVKNMDIQEINFLYHQNKGLHRMMSMKTVQKRLKFWKLLGKARENSKQKIFIMIIFIQNKKCSRVRFKKAKKKNIYILSIQNGWNIQLKKVLKN